MFQVRVLLLWAIGHVIVPGSGGLGAMWAWPDLQGCTGVTLGVADVGADTGATLGMAGACGFGVAGVTGVIGRGCSSCAGLAGAGSGAEMQGLAGTCGCGCCDI